MIKRRNQISHNAVPPSVQNSFSSSEADMCSNFVNIFTMASNGSQNDYSGVKLMKC